MLKQYTLFIKWWIFTVLMTIGFIVCYYSGITDNILFTDTTHICSGIFLVLCYSTLKSGSAAYGLCSKGKGFYNTQKIKNIINYNWFLGNICSGLGILGTVIGMSMMVGDIGKIDLNNIKLENFSNSMQIALLTTIVGIVCKVLIECQNVVIERELDNV